MGAASLDIQYTETPSPLKQQEEGPSRLNSNGVADTCSKQTMEQNRHNLTALKNMYLDEEGQMRFDATLKMGRTDSAFMPNSSS